MSWQGAAQAISPLPKLLGSSIEAAPKGAEAEEFLEEMLADGPRLRSEVEEQARLDGISSRTLRRAHDALGIISEQRTLPGKIGRGPAYWSLPNSAESLVAQFG